MENLNSYLNPSEAGSSGWSNILSERVGHNTATIYVHDV